jgi:hypothetical protein
LQWGIALSGPQKLGVAEWGIVLFSPKGLQPRNHATSVELFEKEAAQVEEGLGHSSCGMEASGHG